jgi:hypothetical protein
LAASVTGWARTLLHKKIRETQAAYCDTDSVVYLHNPRIHPERWDDEGEGLGQWKDELQVGIKGKEFYALAPKCYCLTYDRPDSKGHTYKLKSKGVTMTYENHKHINPETYANLILDAVLGINMDEEGFEDERVQIQAEVFQIILNHLHENVPYLHIITQETKKRVRCVFNKRKLVLYTGYSASDVHSQDFSMIQTVPFGYEPPKGSTTSLSDLFYPEVITHVMKRIDLELQQEQQFGEFF